MPTRSTQAERPPRARPRFAWPELAARAVLVAGIALGAGCGHAGRPEQGLTRASVELRLPAPLDGRPWPARALRIVPSSARGIEFLAELVSPERLAALPEQAFEYASLGAREETFRARPRFEAYLAEPLLTFEPDLVLADPWGAPETNARLSEAGVAVVVLPESVTLDEHVALLRALGAALGELDAAERAAADLSERRARLSARASGRGARQVLGYSNFGSQGFSAGAGTTLGEILNLASCQNALDRLGRRGHVSLTFEDLLLLDPDWIVVSEPLTAPAGSAGDRGGAARAVLETTPSLARLKALRAGHVVSLPAGLFASASHRVLAAAELLVERMEAAEAPR